jgi:putative transposase
MKIGNILASIGHPAKYRWSSYRVNGQGDKSELITHHVLYQNLAHDDEERQFAYRELFRNELEPGEIDKIRKATNGNFALGSSRFAEQISKMLGRRVTPGKAGRPRKKPVVSERK